MRIVALMNQKGGVGKTTTTANLGAALAEMGQRVLLIDLDPQAHLTINYGIEPTGDFTSLYHVLTEEKSLLEAMQKIDERMAIVPSGIDLAAAEIELVSVIGREMLLKKRLESGEAALDFDYVLIDCPPSLGILTINALSAADEVIIPMLPHFLALQGMAKLLETVQLVNKRMNPRLKIGGVVLTMFDSQTKLSGEVVSELENFIVEARGRNLPWSDAIIFETKIRRNIKLAECPSFGETIMKYGPASAGAVDYRALAQEVIRMHKPVQAAAPVVAQIAPPALKPVIAATPKPAPIPPAMPAAPKVVAAAPSTPKATKTAPAKPVAAPVPPKVEVAINSDLNIDKVPVPVPAPKGEVAA